MRSNYLRFDILFTFVLTVFVVCLYYTDTLWILLKNPFLTLFLPYLIGRIVGKERGERRGERR